MGFKRAKGSLLALVEEFLDEVEGALDGFDGIGIGDADEVLAAVAERSAGDDGDVLGFEEGVGKLLAVHARGLHAGEGIERASGFEAGKPHGIEPVHKVSAAFVILLSHLGDLGETVLKGGIEGCESCVLCRGGRAHNAILVDLVNDVDDGLGSADIAQSPARHCEGFGEAADDDGALSHAFERGDGAELDAVVDQLAVDLVRENDKVVFEDDGGEFFEVALLHDRAGGVVGECDEYGFGAGGDRLLDLLHIELELVLDVALDADGRRSGEGDEGGVAHKARFGNEHLVAGGAHRSERGVESLGRADGDDDLACGIVAHADETVKIFAYRLAQFHETGVGCVLSLAFEDAVDRRLAERAGGDEVGFADAQGDAVLSGGCDLEELSDAGRLHISCDGVKDALIIYHISTSYRI